MVHGPVVDSVDLGKAREQACFEEKQLLVAGCDGTESAFVFTGSPALLEAAGVEFANATHARITWATIHALVGLDATSLAFVGEIDGFFVSTRDAFGFEFFVVLDMEMAHKVFHRQHPKGDAGMGTCVVEIVIFAEVVVFVGVVGDRIVFVGARRRRGTGVLNVILFGQVPVVLDLVVFVNKRIVNALLRDALGKRRKVEGLVEFTDALLWQ